MKYKFQKFSSISTYITLKKVVIVSVARRNIIFTKKSLCLSKNNFTNAYDILINGLKCYKERNMQLHELTRIERYKMNLKILTLLSKRNFKCYTI